MLIDKKIDLPSGVVYFKGELADDEVEHLITMGLVFAYLRGDLDSFVTTEDGTLISDVPEQLQ